MPLTALLSRNSASVVVDAAMLCARLNVQVYLYILRMLWSHRTIMNKVRKVITAMAATADRTNARVAIILSMKVLYYKQI